VTIVDIKMRLLRGQWSNSSLFNEFVCILGLFWHEWVSLHTNQLNTTVWPDCDHGHTLPVHGWLFCGGFEIIPEKVGAGLRPLGEITMHLFI
jgi:hypothetical protein